MQGMKKSTAVASEIEVTIPKLRSIDTMGVGRSTHSGEPRRG